MSLDAIRARLPQEAADLKLNLDAVLRPGSLPERRLWTVALAVAVATRRGDLAAAVGEAASAHLQPAEASAALTAASLMAMNNVYYRFTHLVNEPTYSRLPARLRMQGLVRHGGDPVDFELAALAVSALNGCGRCIESHEAKLREQGVAPEAVQDAVRIAAVLAGVAVALEAAELRAPSPN